MGKFNLYFFKERSRAIDIDALIGFFDQYESITVEMDERSVRFKYLHPKLGYQAVFYITPKSQVPNIYALNPKYLEINFHFEIPILTPNYVVKQMIEIAKEVSERFNLFVYSEFFSDVLPFKSDTIFRAYSLVKNAYIEKYPHEAERFIYVSTEKLSAILRYLDEMIQLHNYYKDLNTYVPKYLLFKDGRKPIFSVEWKEGELTVFPPYLDYVIYRVAGKLKMVAYEDFLNQNQKYLMDVPGFLKGTSVLTKKFSKKVHGSMKKVKFNTIEQQFMHLNLHELMD